MLKMNKYLYKFTNISVRHRLDLFDKIISPILNHTSQIERVHLQFCKRLLGVKRSTQNEVVYGELGRHTFQMFKYTSIVKYWVKILHTDVNEYIRKVYNMLKMIWKYIRINQTGVHY